MGGERTVEERRRTPLGRSLAVQDGARGREAGHTAAAWAGAACRGGHRGARYGVRRSDVRGKWGLDPAP